MDSAVGRDQFDTTEDAYDVYGVRWGRLRPVKTKTHTYYESCYVTEEEHLIPKEYRVKDTVYLQASDGPPYIARIEKLRENIKTRKKTMLARWFFRPCELPGRLPNVDYSETSKEVFMAAGSGRGKTVQNPACTIRKCTVLCISKENWNRMPSAEEVAAADHVFDRAFDPDKLKLERLDPSETCGDLLRIRCTKKKPKVGMSTCTGQTGKGRNGEVRRDVGAISKYSGLHSNMVIMGGPPNHFSGPETDHTGKRISSQKSPAELCLKALQRVEIRKRPRGEQEERPRKATICDVKADQERSLKPSGKQYSTTTASHERLKLDVPLTGNGEARKGQIGTVKGDVKPSGQSLDRLLKIPSLDGRKTIERKTIERKHEGSVPFSSSKSAGKHTSMTGGGRAREAGMLGKRSREEGLPSTTKKRLAEDPRSNRRVDEVNLESKVLRPNVCSSQRPVSSLSKHERNDGAVREGLREEQYRASSSKSLREPTAGTKQSKDARVHHIHQHLSSTSINSKSQHGQQVKGTNGSTCREDVWQPSKKIFKFPWEEKKSVLDAISNGRALLLKNLDPYLNSAELEAILENVLDITCDVRILPPKTVTCHKSVEAIVIFKKAEVAEDVLRTLLENILVISEDERSVLASKLTKPRRNVSSFHGFFNSEKFGWKTNNNADQKNAVATSHCAQTNTVEYDMGLPWRVLQDQSEMEWKILEEEHEQEMRKLKSKYQKDLK